ncbi:MAG: hypothetical protein K9H26_09950 [Prolixibacteraceae bacterium]|nr:hypothetical protein [Prolixibacteraceae bacterium]
MKEKNQKQVIKNAAILIKSVKINKPVETVFNYIIYDLKDNYKAMTEDHIKYELLNSEYLKEGTVIDCREKAGNQTVCHHYKVEKIITNRHIFYLSSPSKVYIELPWKTIIPILFVMTLLNCSNNSTDYQLKTDISKTYEIRYFNAENQYVFLDSTTVNSNRNYP